MGSMSFIVMVDVWLEDERPTIANFVSLLILKPFVIFLVYYLILMEESPIALILGLVLGSWVLLRSGNQDLIEVLGKACDYLRSAQTSLNTV